MKRASAVAGLLLIPLMLVAQTTTLPPFGASPQAHTQATPALNTGSAFPFPGGFNPPTGLFDQWWNDPTFASELHLGDAQRKQLQDATLAQQLALIDNGADALKAVAHLAALLEADQFDDAAYKQQLNSLSLAAGKVIQGVGEMAVMPRRVLTVEQWRKLQSLQRAKRLASQPVPPPRPPSTRVPPPGRQ